MTREEAINVMRGWVLANKDREALETILPELKRDDRKRIKENCIHFLELQKSHHASTVEIDECIDWLIGLVPPKWLYRLEYKDGTCGLWYNGEGEWCFEHGIGSLVGCKTKDLPMDHDERYKQGGRDWFSSCSNKEDLLHWYSLNDAEELIKKGFVFTRYLATEYHEYENETVFIKDSSLIREEIDIFELFGKTKPMFKEGDWIIYKDDHTREEDVLVVSNPDPNGTSLYTVKGQQKYYLEWNSLKTARLWTINDARPGDIIVEGSRYITIYQSPTPNSETTFRSFCFVDLDSDVFVDEVGSHNIRGSYPATKKQCDLLFQKIKEAGYEWDEKAKKLVNSTLKEKEEIDTSFTRINEVEGWTEEDKKNYKEILTHLECQGNSATLDVNRKKWRILESWFKRRVPALSELGWTEKDKKNSTYICAALDCYYRLRENKHNDSGQEELDIARNWLYKRLEKIRPYGSTEEDKKMIADIISDLRELRNNETNEELISDYEREIEWLKEKI
jgi:hypothetical protein